MFLDCILSSLEYLLLLYLFLQVIKKVMKMDAAEPFNVPVNPEALGIPVSGNTCCLGCLMTLCFMVLIA